MDRKVSSGGKKSKGQTTERDHLEQVAKQLGKDVEQIEEFNQRAFFPDAASHLWAAFLSLHDGRTYGMSGPNPISYDIIESWCSLMNIRLLPWEIEIIKSLDNLWIKIINEEQNG
jgi:hypothetical protein